MTTLHTQSLQVPNPNPGFGPTHDSAVHAPAPDPAPAHTPAPGVESSEPDRNTTDSESPLEERVALTLAQRVAEAEARLAGWL